MGCLYQHLQTKESVAFNTVPLKLEGQVVATFCSFFLSTSTDKMMVDCGKEFISGCTEASHHLSTLRARRLICHVCA